MTFATTIRKRDKPVDIRARDIKTGAIIVGNSGEVYPPVTSVQSGRGYKVLWFGKDSVRIPNDAPISAYLTQ